MKGLLILGLLLGAPDDAETQRDALLKAVGALDRSGVDRACAALVKLNDDRCPDYFVAAFRAGLLQLAGMDGLEVVSET